MRIKIKIKYFSFYRGYKIIFGEQKYEVLFFVLSSTLHKKQKSLFQFSSLSGILEPNHFPYDQSVRWYCPSESVESPISVLPVYLPGTYQKG